MAEDQEKILQDAKKQPFEARVVHKSWFVKAAAYEDIAAACKKALDPKDDIFHETGTLFVKGLADSNPNVVDKALDALLTYLENCSESAVTRIAGPTCTSLASKTLKGRPGTIKKATDVVLAFLEWEKIEEAMEPIFSSFNDKVPKVVIAAVDIVLQAFSQFGPSVVKPQTIAKALPNVFNAKQEAVRDGVKKIAVEMQGYLGRQYVEGSLCDKMPATMKKDVEKLLDENATLRLTPQRFTKTEQAAQAARGAPDPTEGAASPSQGGNAGAQAAPAQDADDLAYEYAEPQEILSSLNKEFWSGLAAKKWTERRDSLLKLKGLASQPKLQPGDYGDVLRELKKIILKDSMVVIVGEAIYCVGALSKSLRDHFSSSAKQFVSVILEKYKDPKTSVGMAVTEALTQIHKFSLTLIDSAEDICAALESKNPKVKADTARWLQSVVDFVDQKDVPKLNSAFLPTVSKAANDPAPDVREANMGVIVALASKSKNKAILEKVSADWDENRKKRLMDLAGAANDSAPAQNGAVPPLQLSRSARVSPKVSPRQPAATVSARTVSGASKPVMKKLPSKKPVGAAVPKSGPEPTAAADDDDSALSGGSLSESEAKEKMELLLGSELFQGLQDAQWKVRVQSMEGVLQTTKQMTDLSADTACLLIQGLSYIPGWSEKNFQVFALVFEVITYLVSTGLVNKKAAFIAMGGLVDKMSDIKLKGPAGEGLFAVAENISPQFVVTQLHKKASAHKNPKVLSESIIWIAKAVEDFTLAAFDVGKLIDLAKGDLASTNAAVKNAAMQLMAVCHKQLGPGLAGMIRNDIKPALMTNLEELFKKNPQTQVVPTRTVKSRTGQASSSKGAKSNGVHSDGKGDEEAVFDPDALLPRTDISPQLGPKVIASLGSTNWKERNHTMEDIENIIRSASRIQPTVGELIPALKARLTDSNKNLVARALSLYGEVAKAMGPAWERAGRPVLQQCVTFVADNKKQVRDAAVGLLDAWASVVPADKVVPTLVEFLAHPKASNEGKVTGLRWLMGLVEAKKVNSCVDSVLKGVGSALGDKSAEVRDAGSKLGLAVSQAYPQIAREAVSELPSQSQKAVKDLLDRQLGGAQPDLHSSSRLPPQASPRPPAPGNNGASTARSIRTSPSFKATKSSPTRLPLTSRTNAAASAPDLLGPCLLFSSKKDERCQRGRFKSSKFEVPGPSDVEILAAEFESLASPQLRLALFAKDFKKHIEACDMILSQFDQLEREIMSCMDLLLQWIVMRICEANTSCLLKVLALLDRLFELMIAQGYELADLETNTILPCLIEKSGHNQDRLRTLNKELIQQAKRLVTLPRMVEALMVGLTSKNMRTQVDCIEIMSHLIEENSIQACNLPRIKPVAVIAQKVSDRDKSIRGAVLALMEGILVREGQQQVWKHAGNLSDQQRSLIEERFKFVRKAQKIEESTPAKSTPVSRRTSDNGNERSFTPRVEIAPERKRPVDARFQPAMPYVAPATPASNPNPVAPAPNGTPAMKPLSHIPGVSSLATPAPGRSTVHPSPAPHEIVQMDAQNDNDVHDNFCLALNMLSNEQDQEMCVEGAKRMCYVLQSAATEETSEDFRLFLAAHITDLLQILTFQLDKAFELALDEFDETGEANPRACKYFTNAIMMIFDIKEMVAAVAVGELNDLIFVLLTRMQSPDVQNALSSTQIPRALNHVTMKILEDKFGNDIFEALIQLLTTPSELLQERGLSSRTFCDLLTKCLIRTTKLLQKRYEEVDIRQLLMVIHHYLTSLGVDEIRRMGTQDEKSLRMVKTLLHEICKIKGDGVRDLLANIPRESNPRPMIHVYIDLNLEALHGSEYFGTDSQSDEQSHEQENGQRYNLPVDSQPRRTFSSNLPSPGAVASERFPTASATVIARSKDLKRSPSTSGLKSDKSGSLSSQPSWNSSIVPLFQKIGASETSEQGLEELHALMREYPEIDKAQLLSKLSPEFCAFVEKGLNRLQRRQGVERLVRAGAEESAEAYIESQAKDLESRMSKVRIHDGGRESLGIDSLRERLRTLSR